MNKSEHIPGSQLEGQSLSAGVHSQNVLYLEPVAAAENNTGHQKTLRDFLQVLAHRKLVLLLCLVLGVGGGLAVILTETPMYRAHATLEIRTIKSGTAIVSVPGTEPPEAETGPELETQIRILESDRLAERVRARLRADNPERVYRVQDVFAGWRRRLRLPPKKLASQTTAIPEVHTKAVVLGTSRIVEITCESWDPQLTADYTNALASEYIDYNLDNLGQSLNRISSWLANQVRETRGQLEKSENQLAEYTRQANLIYTGDEKEDSAEHKRLRQLQEDLAKATADRMVKQAAYEVAQSSPADAVPEVAHNEQLNLYKSRLLELRRELQDLRHVYTDSHYKVVATLAQIRELEGAVETEKRNILDSIRNEYEQSLRVERLLSQAYAGQIPKVSQTAQKGIQYGVMKWDVETNRRVYEELLERVKAMSIGSSLQANNSTVLDKAKVPLSPYRPAVTRYLLTGGGSGLLIAVLLVFAGQFVNRYLQSPGEAAFHLGIPELGVIPSHNASVSHGYTQRSPGLLSISSEKDRPNVELVTWEDRPSIMAEAYRSTLASILLSANGKRNQVILVTSAARREGKSSTVSNLGIALAEINQRVILIDADLRKPSLHSIFKVANTWGLSDILREKMSLKDSPLEALARATSINNLYVLPSGPAAINIASLLYSDRMSALVDRLRKQFDTIIIDTPPVTYLSDARFVGRLADSAILVVRAGVTKRDAALATQQRLKDDGIPVLGTILNAWDGRAKSHYAYSGYPYYQSEGD